GFICYNTGRDGTGMTFYLTLLNSILSYHTPKVVVLDLNQNDFSLEDNKSEKINSVLLPYIDINTTVRKYLFKEEPVKAWMANFSMLYKYNSLPASILQHHIGIGQKNYKGYEPLKGSKIADIPKDVRNNNDYKEDELLVQKFDSFIKTALKKGIKVLVIISPSLNHMKYNCKKTASQILANYNMQLYDYSEYKPTMRSDLFYDRTHMNNSGAELFTQEILTTIISPLENQYLVNTGSN